jgi:hypothetical protein
MKNQLKSAMRHCKKSMIYTFILSLSIFPVISFGQPAPPGPGGTGGNPDTPLGGVPFDDNLNMLLLMAGVIFAVLVLKKMQKKYVTNNPVI